MLLYDFCQSFYEVYLALPFVSKIWCILMFIKLKKVVEKFFKTPIVSIYSDERSEHIKLESFVEANGNQHLTRDDNFVG